MNYVTHAFSVSFPFSFLSFSSLFLFSFSFLLFSSLVFFFRSKLKARSYFAQLKSSLLLENNKKERKTKASRATSEFFSGSFCANKPNVKSSKLFSFFVAWGKNCHLSFDFFVSFILKRRKKVLVLAQEKRTRFLFCDLLFCFTFCFYNFTIFPSFALLFFSFAFLFFFALTICAVLSFNLIYKPNQTKTKYKNKLALSSNLKIAKINTNRNQQIVSCK